MRYDGKRAGISGERQPTDQPRLMEEVRARMRLKHYSLRTEQAYLYWIRRYIRASGMRHPRALDGKFVESFLTRLAAQDHVAASTQNQALSAILFLYRDVLAFDLPWMADVVRAKRPPRLPVVLSLGETDRLLAQLHGRDGLIAGLLYGAGLRLMECLRLRVKDIDFARNEITVREGKGNKDRRTMLPARLREPLQRQLDGVRLLHAEDLAAGFGEVALPHALARKYPNATTSLAWQYVFPSTRLGSDPRDGRRKRHHLDENVLQRAIKRAAKRAGFDKAGHAAHAAPQLRHPPAGGRRGHPHHPGAARPQGRGDDADLHPRAQSRAGRRAQSAGPLRHPGSAAAAMRRRIPLSTALPPRDRLASHRGRHRREADDSPMSCRWCSLQRRWHVDVQTGGSGWPASSPPVP